MVTASNTNLSVGRAPYVEWSAIIAGTVIACTISLVLLQFGQAIGLSIPKRYDDSYTSLKIFTIGLWLLWVQLMASLSGGYLAGRMCVSWAGSTPSENEIRDGVHGLLVWATSTLVAVAAAAIAGVLAALAAQYGVDMAQEAQAEMAAIPEHVARRYGVIFGFGAVAGSIVSGLAAYAMGAIGGDHRDGEIDLSRYSFRAKIRAAVKGGKKK